MSATWEYLPENGNLIQGQRLVALVPNRADGERIKDEHNAFASVANPAALEGVLAAIDRHLDGWGGASMARPCRHAGSGDQLCCIRFHLAALRATPAEGA